MKIICNRKWERIIKLARHNRAETIEIDELEYENTNNVLVNIMINQNDLNMICYEVRSENPAFDNAFSILELNYLNSFEIATNS